MSLLATSSRKRRTLGTPGSAGCAPAPGRSSIGQSIPRLLLAVTWSLLPGVIGLVLTLLLADRIGWALLVFAAHQLTAWCLMLRVGRWRHLRRSDWISIAIGTGLTIVVCAPIALPWLLLPVLPAILLRSASRHGPPPRVAPVMRIFSIASLAAVLVQLAADHPGVGVIVAVVGATVLGLAALEHLVVPINPRPNAAQRSSTKI